MAMTWEKHETYEQPETDCASECRIPNYSVQFFPWYYSVEKDQVPRSHTMRIMKITYVLQLHQ